MGDQAGALEDYNRVIALKSDYINAYFNRAICYRKLADEEQDPVKKTKLLAKAETDEQKAALLK